MIPESQYIEASVLVRDMRMPQEVTLTKASLIRWLALALGLINPNESRKSLIDLVEVMLNHQLKARRGISVEEIMEKLKAGGKTCGEKTVRYHLLRMERKGVVRRKNKEYSFLISDLDDAGIESIADSYDMRYRSAMEKVRIALAKLKGMY